MAEWVTLGDRAIRFARPAGSVRGLLAALRAWPGVLDVAVTSDDVAVYFGSEPTVDPGAIDRLAAVPAAPTPTRTIDLRVVYDGPDLTDVARAAGVSEAELVRLHAAAVYEVAWMGFAPGFGYLTGLDPRLHLPRRATPRPRVPAGSIALAGGYTAVYPFESPGGWHLIGRIVGIRMFDGNGALLEAGDRVRFVP